MFVNEDSNSRMCLGSTRTIEHDQSVIGAQISEKEKIKIIKKSKNSI